MIQPIQKARGHGFFQGEGEELLFCQLFKEEGRIGEERRPGEEGEGEFYKNKVSL